MELLAGPPSAGEVAPRLWVVRGSDKIGLPDELPDELPGFGGPLAPPELLLLSLLLLSVLPLGALSLSLVPNPPRRIMSSEMTMNKGRSWP